MRRNQNFAYWTVLLGSCLIAASLVNAETPSSKPNSAAKGLSGVPLSKKLDKNEGVIEPPRGIDPGMHQKPPVKTGDKMPVIIPPGEPGGDPSIQPK